MMHKSIMVQTVGSGVQRLLDARGQQVSWMPSKIFSILRPAKFLKTFLVISPWMPSSAASCPGNDIFLFFFVIYLHFLRKLTPWMPQGGRPGSRTVHIPSARH